jgi:NAD(P)-dependent dehydrogenase (short-subunit alcohol dehydrogenase family)/acyl carrier protein
VKRLAARVADAFAKGEFHGLPTKVFPPDEVQSAFRSVSHAEHIGKIAIGLSDQSITLAAGNHRTEFGGDRSILITGAFGGLGRCVCSWLVSVGARHLVMVGRRGAATEAAQRVVDELRRAGATIEVVAADVSEARTVEALIGRFGRDFPPLLGIMHLAMVLDDGVFTSMNAERIQRVMRPKAWGAWHLHRATQQMPLDFFVLFSSISSLSGGLGQSNYAAANAFLDALAVYRRSSGLPAISINWGALGESGVVAENPELMQMLRAQGLEPLSDEQVRVGLDVILRGSWTQIALMKLDARVFDEANGAMSEHVRALLNSARPAQAGMHKGLLALRDELVTIPATSRQQTAEACVGAIVATVLRTTVDRLEMRRPLSTVGVDSLMATEVSLALMKEYGVRFAVLDILRKLSVADIAAQVLAKAAPENSDAVA